VWCRLEKQSLKDLAHSLVNEFDVGIQTAIEHVSEMIRMFRTHSLLVVEPRDESHD